MTKTDCLSSMRHIQKRGKNFRKSKKTALKNIIEMFLLRLIINFYIKKTENECRKFESTNEKRDSGVLHIVDPFPERCICFGTDQSVEGKQTDCGRGHAVPIAYQAEKCRVAGIPLGRIDPG